MRFASPFAVLVWVALLLCMLFGCSNNNSPTTPNPSNNLNPLDESRDITTTPGHHMLGAFSLDFDLDSLTVIAIPNREAMAHYNVTPFLLPPNCYDCFSIEIKDAWPEEHMMKLRVKVKNPYPVTGYDVRGILMHNQPGWDIEIKNGYTSLFDDGGAVTINPFFLFHQGSDYTLPPGEIGSRLFTLFYPENPDFAHVGFVIDACWPGHCEDVYSIKCNPDSTGVDRQGMLLYIEAWVLDHQEDVLSVTLDATNIGGAVMAFEQQPGTYTWTGEFFLPGASGGADPGPYRLLVTAETNSPILTYTYVDVFLNPLPPPEDVTPLYLDFMVERIVHTGKCLITSSWGDVFDIFNITTPAKPKWASTGYYDYGPDFYGGHQAMVVVEDRAYMLGSEQPAGIRVFDISDINNPYFVGFVETDIEFSHSLETGFYNGYIYAGMSDGYCVIDTNTSPLPTVVYYYPVAWKIEGITVHNGYLYFERGNSNEIIIAALDDPANPEVVNEYEVGSGAFTRLIGVGDYLFRLNKSSYGYNLSCYDVSSPTQPELVCAIDLPVRVRSFCIVDGYAYVPGGEDGIAVVDISDPANMELVTVVPTEGGATYAEPGVGMIYIAERFPGGLSTYDISDPENPQLVDRIETFDFLVGKGFVLLDDYALVLEQSSPPGIHWSFLRVVDISTPERPRIVSTLDNEDYVQDMAVSGNACYLIKNNPSWDNRLDIVVVDEFSEAQVVSSVDLNTSYSFHRLAVGNGYAYIPSGEGLIVVDVDPPEDAHVVAVHESIHAWGDITIKGSNIYILTSHAVRVFDATSPEAPVQIGGMSFENSGGTIIARANYAYIGTSDGVYVVDISDPSAMEITDEAHFEFTSRNIHLMGGFLFTASYGDGVGIFKIFPPGTIEPVFNLAMPDGRGVGYVACKDGYMFLEAGYSHIGRFRVYKWW